MELPFEVIDQAKDWGVASGRFLNDDIWNIALCEDGTIGLFGKGCESGFARNVEKNDHIKLRQEFRDGAFFYYPEKQTFVMKGI